MYQSFLPQMQKVRMAPIPFKGVAYDHHEWPQETPQYCGQGLLAPGRDFMAGRAVPGEVHIHRPRNPTTDAGNLNLQTYLVRLSLAERHGHDSCLAIFRSIVDSRCKT